MSVVASQVTISCEKPVDREKVCPFLLRVFCSNDRHNRVQEYTRGITPFNELQMYTWMDCSLKELTLLIKEVNPDSRKLSPEKYYPRYISRDIGTTKNGSRGNDDNKTLQMCKFEIGDYIDVAIIGPYQGNSGAHRFTNELGDDYRRPYRPFGYRDRY